MTFPFSKKKKKKQWSILYEYLYIIILLFYVLHDGVFLQIRNNRNPTRTHYAHKLWTTPTPLLPIYKTYINWTLRVIMKLINLQLRREHTKIHIYKKKIDKNLLCYYYNAVRFTLSYYHRNTWTRQPRGPRLIPILYYYATYGAI